MSVQHRHHFSPLERLMLRSAHPAKLVLDAIGGTLGFYFLWKHELALALLMGGLYIGNAALVAFLLGDERRQSLSRTLWGRIFLRFGKPVPFMLYVMADIAIPVGAYLRDLQVVGAGILLIIIALALPHKASSRIRKRDYEQLVRAIVGVNEPLMQPHQSVRQRRSSSR